MFSNLPLRLNLSSNINSVEQAKNEIGYLSISFDEWTSLKHRKYMALIVHFDVTMWHLGLIRIRGKTNHFLVVADIDQKLESFDLCQDDLISMITDSASINAAIAKDLNKNHQKCLAHAFQLAIKLTFYQCDEIDDEQNCEIDDDKADDVYQDDEDEKYESAEHFTDGLDENLPRLEFKGIE